MTNHEWYLRFEGKRYPVEYRVYHLVGEDMGEELTLHEIEYRGRVITQRRLEDAIKEIGKLIRRKNHDK